MFDHDVCNGRNINQNTLGVKWQERMIKRIIVVFISDKKERRLGYHKLDPTGDTDGSCLRFMNEWP